MLKHSYSRVNGVWRVNYSTILEFWEEDMTSDQVDHVFIFFRDREPCVGRDLNLLFIIRGKVRATENTYNWVSV